MVMIGLFNFGHGAGVEHDGGFPVRGQLFKQWFLVLSQFGLN